MRNRGGGGGLVRLVLGLGAVALGLLLFLDNMGLFDARPALRYLPGLALLGIGLAQLVEYRRLSFGVAAWLFVGGWLLLDARGLVRVDFWDAFWPLLLIGLGASMVLRAAARGGRDMVGFGKSGGGEAAPPASAESRVQAMAFLGGVDRRSASPALQSVDAVAVLGGAVVDLRQAKAATRSVEVEAFALWAGVEIIVPPTWEVENRVIPILGGVEDKTQRAELQPEAERVRVVVRGFAVMGGVDIANQPSSS